MPRIFIVPTVPQPPMSEKERHTLSTIGIEGAGAGNTCGPLESHSENMLLFLLVCQVPPLT